MKERGKDNVQRGVGAPPPAELPIFLWLPLGEGLARIAWKDLQKMHCRNTKGLPASRKNACRGKRFFYFYTSFLYCDGVSPTTAVNTLQKCGASKKPRMLETSVIEISGELASSIFAFSILARMRYCEGDMPVCDLKARRKEVSHRQHILASSATDTLLSTCLFR